VGPPVAIRRKNKIIKGVNMTLKGIKSVSEEDMAKQFGIPVTEEDANPKSQDDEEEEQTELT